MEVYTADGGRDIHTALARGGEPANLQLAASYGATRDTNGLTTLDVTDLWALNERRYAYQVKYAEYWNDSAKRTNSGRVVDAVLLPVAPSASFRPGEGVYSGEFSRDSGVWFGPLVLTSTIYRVHSRRKFAGLYRHRYSCDDS